MTPRELLAELRALNLGGFAMTHSGAPFLEVLAEGVSKAWGLEQLCARLGVRREEVLAFGDAPNDAEMLAWAGHGVAVANAEPEALEAADEVTLSNAEDGVAVVTSSAASRIPSLTKGAIVGWVTGFASRRAYAGA